MALGWCRATPAIGPGYCIPAPITHQEIVAWAWLHRVRPSPAETKVLRDLDNAYLEFHSSKNSKDEPPVDYSQSMSPELFDRLFPG